MRTKSVPSKKFSKTYRVEISNRLSKMVGKRAALQEPSKATNLEKVHVDMGYSQDFPPLIEDGTTDEPASCRFFSQEDVNILPNQGDERPPSNDHLLKLAKESDDQDICPERYDQSFWEHPTTKRTGI